MKSIKGTETEKNLLKAFAGESEARNRYTYFAGVAKKAGYEQIAAIFLETADNEKEHAKVFFKLLKDACVEVTHAVCTAPLESTEDCLLAAAAGEHDEWSDMYPAFAEVADREGFPPLRKLSARLPPWSSTMKPATSSWLKMCAKAGFLPRRRKSNGSAATAVMYIPVPLPPRYVRLVHIPRHSLKNWRTTFNNLFSRNMIGAGFTS